MTKLKIFCEKIRSFEFLESGNPSSSKLDFTNFSSSLVPILKFSSYSLKIIPDNINAVRTSIFLNDFFQILCFFLNDCIAKVCFQKKFF